jgi:hypothetical protein
MSIMKLAALAIAVTLPSMAVTPSRGAKAQCECLWAFYHEEPNGGVWWFEPDYDASDDGECDGASPPCPMIYGCHIEVGWTYTTPSGGSVLMALIQPNGERNTITYTSGSYAYTEIDPDCGKHFCAMPLLGVTPPDYMWLLCTACEGP